MGINSIGNVLGFGLVLMLLSSCGGIPNISPIQITSAPAERPPLVLPPVDTLTMRPVEWVIVNKDNVDEVFAQLEASGQNLALFALTDEGYENLGLNFSDIRQLVQQQRAIIVAYENYVNNNGESTAQ